MWRAILAMPDAQPHVICDGFGTRWPALFNTHSMLIDIHGQTDTDGSIGTQRSTARPSRQPPMTRRDRHQ